jgi:hypothetical protein
MSKSSSLAALSAALNVPIDWINNVISFESSWNPIAINSTPYNAYEIEQQPGTLEKHAKGLIQFTDETAQWLGYTDSQDLIDQCPDIDSQMLGPVQEYFKKYAPYQNQQQFFMAVFDPALMNVSPSTVISAAAQYANKGIVTVQDYIDKAEKAGAAFLSSITDNEGGGLTVSLLVAAIAVTLYYILK